MNFLKKACLNLIVPLTLAACQNGGPAPASPASSASILRPYAPRPAIPNQPPPAAEAPSPPPSLAELAADPQRFKGMSAADLHGLLGTPSFQRKDADAEIWQYYGPSSSCVLDLFVYLEQGVPRVAHAEVRSRNAGSTGSCLAQILDGKRG